ncbi:hypothetical protein JW911_03860 [Candidatus Peregrinibacteria bacterium]|nr:hypothetical protein [Candidatus Peregrinibacteria bacterium]
MQNQEIKQPEKGPNAYEQAVLSWEAQEFIQHEKGWKWFVLAGIGLTAFCAYSIYTDNWTLFIALAIIALLYLWQHFSTQPQMTKIIISRIGIKAGDKEYPFHNIKAFWIIYNPPKIKQLHLRFSTGFKPDVILQLGDQEPGELREYLCSQIREIEGMQESFSDHLIRIFKL